MVQIMPSLLSSRRATSALTLRVRSADELDDHDAGPEEPPQPQLPWYAAGALAGALAAVGGWLLLCGLVVLIWFTARAGAVLDAVRAGTEVWLLANGGGLELGGQRWTLTPLLLTALLGVLIAQGAGHTARQGLRADVAAGAQHEPRDLARIVRNVTFVTAAGYAVLVTITGSILGGSDQGVRALVGSAVLGVLAAYLGAARAVGHRLADVLPGWAKPVPGAVGWALLVMTVAGIAVLVTALVLGFDQVRTITTGLGAGAGIGAIIVQLLYLPNLVLWGGSWALGAGFRFGEGSVISPRNTDLGLLPSIPVLGALPAEGPGSPWSLCWLASGAVAGAVAAWWVMRRRPRARFDETAIVGGLSGILAGLAYTLLAAFSGGDLGTDRLRGVGPRLTELAVMSGALMGITGLAVGLVWGLVRRPGAEPDADELDDDGPDETDDDPTEVVGDEPTTQLGRPRAAERPATDVIDPDDDLDPDDEPTEVVEEETVVVDEETEVIAPRKRWNPFSRR